jgi:hypothetical protein
VDPEGIEPNCQPPNIYMATDLQSAVGNRILKHYIKANYRGTPTRSPLRVSMATSATSVSSSLLPNYPSRSSLSLQGSYASCTLSRASPSAGIISLRDT